ncbi:uncharacterized protein KQ657_000291 [Scheffersomyces spartinae]|uniref:Uncharacterized protein n=1 Tax=Scheffersomyces spartinae TaxID=45513 RepID=A0A9P8AKT7_9ASCO|nr:uncharacterized protein KQ657_000291 [Scheffersomyces spartinae]KAG7196276.1 hypothetical protein KQ657_000291 [Scheffersomyces spartinae]
MNDLGNSNARISRNFNQPRTIQSSLESLSALYNSRNTHPAEDLEWLNSCEYISDRLKFLKALYKNIAILRRSKLRERARSLSNANSSSSVDLVRSNRGSSTMPATSETEATTNRGNVTSEPRSAGHNHNHQYLTVSDRNPMTVPVTMHLGIYLDNNSESRDEMDFEEDEVEDLASPGTKLTENDELHSRSISPAVKAERDLESGYGMTYVSSPITRELSAPLVNENGSMSESS